MKMPIKATPYRHQQEAFDFITRMFGLHKEVIPTTTPNAAGAALLMEMGVGRVKPSPPSS